MKFACPRVSIESPPLFHISPKTRQPRLTILHGVSSRNV
jgi:hypothetical protein